MTFRGKDLYAVCLLSAIAMFLFADQNLMAPNLTDIANEFGFTEEERDVKLGGHIALVFWLLGGAITLFIGYFTDRVSRKWLLGAVVVIGEVPCFLTGFAETYDQLFWLRALTGIGIGGAMPLVYSLIGDYFPARQRSAAIAFVGLAMGLGIVVGQLLAGFLGEPYGWRLPFIIVASPNFVLGLLFVLTIKEPKRGQSEARLGELIEEGHSYNERIDWASYRRLFRIRSNLLIFVQGALGTVPWGVFFVYMNDFLSEDKGFGKESGTLIVSVVGLAAIVGSFVGGLWGNRVYNRKRRSLPKLCGITTLLGVIPTVLLINYPSQGGEASILLPTLIGVAAGFLATITAPNVRAMLLNVNAPETRGSIFGLFNLADDLGKGFGPAIISLMIIALGRTWAFNAAMIFWIACGLILLAMVNTFPEDEAVLEEKLAHKAKSIALEAARAKPSGGG